LDKFSDFKVYPYLKMTVCDREVRGSERLGEVCSEFEVEAFCVRIMPGIFDRTCSRFLLDMKAYFDPNVLFETQVPFYKDAKVVFTARNSMVGYRNGKPEQGVDYLERAWTIDELEKLATTNGYMSDSLRDLLDTWRQKRYIFDTTKNRISVESYGDFEADWTARLDFDGKHPEADDFDKVFSEYDFVFPREKPEKHTADDFWAMTEFREETFKGMVYREIVRPL
jgi:hypothetical protein